MFLKLTDNELKSCTNVHSKWRNVFDIGANLFGNTNEIENTQSDINRVFHEFNANEN